MDRKRITLSALALSLLVLVNCVEYSNAEESAAPEDLRFKSKAELNSLIQTMSKEINLASEPDVKSFFNRGVVFKRLGKIRQAIEDFNAAIELKPDYGILYETRGDVYLLIGEVQKAIDDYERFLKGIDKSLASAVKEKISKAKSYTTLRYKLDRVSEKKQSESYSNLLNGLLEIAPMDKSLLELRVEFNRNEERPTLILKDISTLLTLHPNKLEYYLHASNAYLSLGNVFNSLKAVKSCIRHDPDNKLCLAKFKEIRRLENSIEEASDLFEKGDFGEALKIIDEVYSVAVKGRDGIDWQEKKAHCHLKVKDYAKCVEECGKILDSDRDNIRAHELRVMCNEKRELWGDALDDLQWLMQRDSSNMKYRKHFQNVQKKKKVAEQKDYYKVLNVSRDATTREIKRAFRKMAFIWHPDKAKDKKLAEQKYMEISEAYDVLKDEEKRKKYDAGDYFEDPSQQPFHTPGFPFGGFQGGFGGGGSQFQFSFGGMHVKFGGR